MGKKRGGKAKAKANKGHREASPTLSFATATVCQTIFVRLRRAATTRTSPRPRPTRCLETAEKAKAPTEAPGKKERDWGCIGFWYSQGAGTYREAHKSILS